MSDNEDWNEDEEEGWDDDDPDWAENQLEEENINDEEDWKIEVENLYSTAESEKKKNPQASLKNFEKCVKLEEDNSPKVVYKRFASIGHIVLLLYQLSKTEEMLKYYSKLLSYAESVSPNDLTTTVRNILNTIQEKSDHDSLIKMYTLTLEYFKNKSGKERLWFEFSMRLCKLYLDYKGYDKCKKLLNELHNSCRLSNGDDDMSKGGQLLEIYAIEIQLMTLENNHVALNELFSRTNQLCADINDPRSMSVIKECWGKMYASMNQWNDAYSNFFDAFRSYQDIGHANSKLCLKYVVISSMLSDMSTNPFATQEARVFQTNPDIVPINSLLESFHNDDIKAFENILNKNKSNILNDNFISDNILAVKLRLRSRVLVKLIKPYKRIKLSWLCTQLNCNEEEIENLIVNLILDGTIIGRLNQIHSLLDLDLDSKTTNEQLNHSLEQWTLTIKRLQNNINARAIKYDVQKSNIPSVNFMDYEIDDGSFMGFYDEDGADPFLGNEWM